MDSSEVLKLDSYNPTKNFELRKHLECLSKDRAKQWAGLIVQCIGQADILCLGWDQIRKVVDMLAENPVSNQQLVLPLHSLMPTAGQGAIFNRPLDGVRKGTISLYPHILTELTTNYTLF